MRTLCICTMLAGTHIACASETQDTKAPARSAERERQPAYALASAVSDASGNYTTYIKVVDSLDVDSIEASQGREYPGIVTIEAHGGKLYVADGEAPTVTRFAISDTGDWSEEGTLSFADYGLSSASLFTNAFVSEDRSYMAYGVVDRVLWQPSSMTILGTRDAEPDLAVMRDDLFARHAYERALRGDKLFQPYYWADTPVSYFDRVAPTSMIAVYDTRTDETLSVLEAPCPGLDNTSIDEDGNIYFSNGFQATPVAVFDPKAAPTCMVRIKAGEANIDRDFSLRFSDLTDGREAGTFRYLADGVGFITVLHDERIPDKKASTPSDAAASANWRLWTLDLQTQNAAPIEGLEFISGLFDAVRVDGRTFIMLADESYQSTTAFEIVDGSAVRRFTTDIWTYTLVKIR